MKELTQRRNLDFKHIINKIKSDGMAEIDNFLDEDSVEKLQKYIFEEINNQPKGYMGCVGKKNLKGSPLENIDSEYGINSILESLLPQISGNKIKDKKLYQVLRVLFGENQGLKKAYKFHYDAYALTALLPILIPEREDGMNGDFLYSMQRRKLHQNFLRNVIEKFIIQNSISQFFLSKSFIRKKLNLKVCRLKPGKLYIFSGFQTIHGNSPCSPNSPRATVLFHYADPFSQNMCFKLVERLNILRVDLKRKIGK